MVLRLQILILFLNLYQCVFSQDGSVRVRVFGGGTLDFVFNSISEYKTGITYLNYTMIGIEATEGVPTDRTAWRIEVSADDADADGNLNGTNPANTIPLSSVEVQATSVSSCVPLPCPINLFGSPWLPLSNVPTIIVDGNAVGGADDIPPNLSFATDQVNISFRCGVTTSLLGETADYYSDDIFFDILLTPPF